MDQNFRRNNAIFLSNSNKYLAVDMEEKIIEEYFPAFAGLYNHGEIGRERRLDWIEALRSSGLDIKLPSLNYSITSQVVYTPDFLTNMGRFRFYKSDMTLKMQLLHEGDLFNLLDALSNKAKGVFRVKECKINSRVTDTLSDNPAAGNVDAECLLEWFTLKLSDGSDIKV